MSAVMVPFWCGYWCSTSRLPLQLMGVQFSTRPPYQNWMRAFTGVAPPEFPFARSDFSILPRSHPPICCVNVHSFPASRTVEYVLNIASCR